MSGTVFAVVAMAALLHAIWNAMVKADGDRLVMMAVIMGSQSVIAGLMLPFFEMPPAEAWPYIWASIVLHNGYYLFLVLSYRYGDLSHVYPIARGSSPLIVALISVYYVGEELSFMGTVSVGIIAFGIMSLTLARGRAGFQEPKAFLFAFGTGIFIALYTITDGLGVRLAGNAHNYSVWLFALDGLPLIPITLMLRGKSAIIHARRIMVKGTFAGLASMTAYWCVIWAMTETPMALVSAVRETSMIFAVLFGVFFLKERFDWQRLLSTCITLAGALLLKFSR